MLSRLICFILVGALLLQMGCAKTASTIRPEPQEDTGLPIIASKAEVTLRRQTLLHGRYGADAVTQRVDSISGELLASNEGFSEVGAFFGMEDPAVFKGCLIIGCLVAVVVAAVIYYQLFVVFPRGA